MKKISLLLVSLSLFCSCSKDDAVTQTVIPTGQGTTSVAFFNAKLGSVSFNYEQNYQGPTPNAFNDASASVKGTGSERTYSYTSVMRSAVPPGSVPSLEIKLHNVNKANNDTNQSTNFKSSMQLKSSNFITTAQSASLIKGVSVTYTGENNVVYTSLAGQQASSQINFTSSVDGINGFDKQIHTVTGTVTCKLYNQANLSDIIELTNGSFKLTFEEK